MCACDGLCKLDREELLAVLNVRLSRLSAEEIRALNVYVMAWKQANKEATK